MRENSSRPAGKRSRDPFTIEPDAPVTECENASMQGNQLASRNSALDQSLPNPSDNQLSEGDHSMLPLSQSSNYKGRLVPRKSPLVFPRKSPLVPHRNVFSPP